MPLPTHEDEKQHPKRETSRKQRGRARCRVDEVERKATFHTGPKAERGQKGGQHDILAPRASWIWTKRGSERGGTDTERRPIDQRRATHRGRDSCTRLFCTIP